MNEYIKSFVIGSSWLSFIIFFSAVDSYEKQKIINYDYNKYTFKAPLVLGFIAMFAKFINLNTQISLWKSLLIASLFSSISVMIGITINKSYSFENKQRWYLQYLTVLIGHVFTFTVIVYSLENIIN